MNRRNRNLVTTPVAQPDPPTQRKRKRVQIPVTQPESDTNDTDISDTCDDTGTGTDSSDTDTDSSDTGTDTDDCPLSHVVQEKNIRVGVSIAKYFGDELYFGHIHALPKSGL